MRDRGTATPGPLPQHRGRGCYCEEWPVRSDMYCEANTNANGSIISDPSQPSTGQSFQTPSRPTASLAWHDQARVFLADPSSQSQRRRLVDKSPMLSAVKACHIKFIHNAHVRRRNTSRQNTPKTSYRSMMLSIAWYARWGAANAYRAIKPERIHQQMKPLAPAPTPHHAHARLELNGTQTSK